MASGNGNEGMLRRMVKMVATPARDLMTSRPSDAGPSQFADLEKAELKAMIERKRRNDFVRKRELDMLRRIRREGLSAEQAQALGASSRIDDSDVKVTNLPFTPEQGVKAKIDAIEQQMVGFTVGNSSARISTTPAKDPSSGGALPTRQLATPMPVPMSNDATTRPVPNWQESGLPATDSTLRGKTLPPGVQLPVLHDTLSPPIPPAGTPSPSAGRSKKAAGSGTTKTHTRGEQAHPHVAPQNSMLDSLPPALSPLGGMGAAVEVSEIAHDQDLDEAVIAFANADFGQCERTLVQLTSHGGARHKHNDTWLVLFDLYRATGQQSHYETLANDYVLRFQRSAPQWFSLPKLVADSTGGSREQSNKEQRVSWSAKTDLDLDAVGLLHSQTLQQPLPWILDWSRLKHIDIDAAGRLFNLLKDWAKQPLQMQWLGLDQLLQVLVEAAPVGVRDADPAYWMVRMEILRLINRPDQFDEVAIDYCVTYEVSPPSWEATKCTVRPGGASAYAQTAPLSVLSEAITTIQDAGDGQAGHSMTSLELSGQLAGDIGPLLATLDRRLRNATAVRISCALLIRVDFIAAGDLLNWVISKRSEGRQIRFTDVHRLVALMFGAMGIIEHAQVSLRQA